VGFAVLQRYFLQLYGVWHAEALVQWYSVYRGNEDSKPSETGAYRYTSVYSNSVITVVQWYRA
jgi:hypothetical protein